MKLTHLDLSSFRSYRGVSLDLDAPRVLIAGLNGAGKTSIREAIRWTLLGRCEGTDGRGAGAEVLIPTGSKTADVALTLAGIGRIARSYAEHGGGAFSVEGFTGTSQIQHQALFGKLQTSPEFLNAVLDTSAFLDLSHADAKAMVLSLLGVRIEVHKHTDACKAATDTELGDTLVCRQRTHATLDELDVLYKQSFEDRKLAKKALQQHHVPEKPTAQVPAIDAIEGQLTKLRSQLGELRQSVGAVAGQRSALQSELTRLETERAAPVGEDLSGQIDGLQAKLASLEAAVVPAQTDAPKPGDPQRLTFLRSAVAALQKHQPSEGCVIDREIPCKTLPGSFRDRLTALNAELKAMDPRPDTSSQTATESPLTAVRRQLQDLQNRQAQREAKIEAQGRIDGRIQQIRAELAGLPDTAAQDAEIATLQTRIGKGEELLRTARTHYAAVKAHEEAAGRQQTLKADVDRLEELVERLGPKGVRVQALSEAMGRFEAAVNPYVQPFGWTLSFSVDPWEVIANGRPAGTYSKSEQFRIGVALQLGIALLSGLKFAVVDEMDMLDVGKRSLVTKMLLSAQLEQILILGMREDSQALPRVDGVLAYRLAKQGDQTVVAEAVGAEVAA